MSLIYDLPYFEDIISDVVDSIRETGTIDNVVFASGRSTVTSENSLKENEIVKINNKDYRVFAVEVSSFMVTGDVSPSIGQQWKACAPYFLDGHLLEIANILTEKDNSVDTYKYKKYPLIVLTQDYKGEHMRHSPDRRSEVDFLFITYTDMNYSSKDRREKVFKPILDPLYSKFFEALDKARNIHIINMVGWTYWRRNYWGSKLNDKNIFNEFNDAIEVKNIELETTLKC